jgi:hypothetical protein
MKRMYSSHHPSDSAAGSQPWKHKGGISKVASAAQTRKIIGVDNQIVKGDDKKAQFFFVATHAKSTSDLFFPAGCHRTDKTRYS